MESELREQSDRIAALEKDKLALELRLESQTKASGWAAEHLSRYNTNILQGLIARHRLCGTRVARATKNYDLVIGTYALFVLRG